MSYDIDLTIDTGGEEPYVVEEFNITYNIRPMLQAAAEASDFNLGWFTLSDLDGAKAGQVSAWAKFMLQKLKSDDPAMQAELAHREPKNNWGSLPQLVQFMEAFEFACRRHPKTTVKVH